MSPHPSHHHKPRLRPALAGEFLEIRPDLELAWLDGLDAPALGEGIVQFRLRDSPWTFRARLLVNLFKDPHKVSGDVIEMWLRQIGPDAIPQLLVALKDEDPEVRWMAAWTIGGIERAHGERTIPALQEASKDSNEDVRKWADWALGELVPKAQKSP